MMLVITTQNIMTFCMMILSIMALSITMLSKMALGITIQNKKTLSIKTLINLAHSKTTLKLTFCILTLSRTTLSECHYTEYCMSILAYKLIGNEHIK
jgi:hypothetical protein